MLGSKKVAESPRVGPEKGRDPATLSRGYGRSRQSDRPLAVGACRWASRRTRNAFRCVFGAATAVFWWMQGSFARVLQYASNAGPERAKAQSPEPHGAQQITRRRRRVLRAHLLTWRCFELPSLRVDSNSTARSDL